ncbi:hyaluronidase-1-like [Spea bombifrons]|uniref:hyaluronidase-1-like n=1 Tax=Spea bombifrons TaxID=233779 RepID=UPI00234AFD89|nr:hyaluronidase-1-like [Spea bombifrons]
MCCSWHKIIMCPEIMSPKYLFQVIICVTLSLLVFFPSASADPVLNGQPFVTIWNAPTARCYEQFGVTLDLGAFDIVKNQNYSFLGSEVVIFYNTQIGLYPYFDEEENPINDGLPQNASLRDHLAKASVDLEAAIPDPFFKGVAVVDWENWRPLWIRNWDKMTVYKERSADLVRQRYPEWPQQKILKAAKLEFEAAAREFMQSTLELGCKMKPGGLWGFYGFPSCYNYNYKKTQNYTGECPKREIRRNDLLSWLWGASRALFPDIYLEQDLKMSEYVGRFVKHRIEEGFRVSKVAGGVELPVVPYARIVYTYSMDFLTQEDLIQTLGQSAALGTAGVILWGNADYSVSKESCLAVKSYIDDTLGMYVVNVTTGAMLCSKALCSGNGRCVRKDSSSEVYLHLNPGSFIIKKNLVGQGFLVSGQSTKEDITHMATYFQCRCYSGWKGTDCSEKTMVVTQST